MKILILDFDLFKVVGGGQAFYRSLIVANPDLEFFYLRRAESAESARPAHAHAIPYRQHYQPAYSAGDDLSRSLYVDYLFAMNVAWSVKGYQFDLIDSPDYHQGGLFILRALNLQGVWCQRRAISLHGVISRTIRMQWQGDPHAAHIAAQKERLQYLASGVRYGISRAYIDEWLLETGIRSQYLHPASFLKGPQPAATWPSPGVVDLNFIGRKEKRKGPDLFLDLAWWLRSAHRGAIQLFGDEVQVGRESSREILARLAENRGIDAVIEPSVSASRLQALFFSRSVTIVPSRWDTLNFVALESLFAGCPTVIGSGAGVCRLIEESLPGVPFVRFDVEDPFSAVAEVERLLAEYDSHRSQLKEALEQCEWKPDGLKLYEIYESPESRDRESDQYLDDRFRQFLQSQGGASARVGQPERAVRGLVARFQFASYRERLGKARQLLGLVAGRKLFPQAGLPLIEQVGRSPQFQPDLDWLRNMPERSQEEFDKKHAQGAALVPLIRLNRAPLFRLMAETERRRGDQLLAAVYELRLMRWMGQDLFNTALNTKSTLVQRGYPSEAAAALAILRRDSPQSELLESARSGHHTPPVPEFEVYWDMRQADVPRVSVVVSLYRAESKLTEFLRRFSEQTLLRNGDVELIFVDSCSPHNELGAIRSIATPANLPYLYVRTPERETIQKAWNRGIDLARGKYLAFLGVDETDHPEALEVLANELDRCPDVDWVQGACLIASVSSTGAYESDVMAYARPITKKWGHYLDCTYLYYVAALYRKSIHDRFGYYDESFGAAGDTEFKNRILPFISTKTLDMTLGQFLNYPEERTTASPRAEIEDTRAWYLHRTPAGMRYAFPVGSEESAIELLRASLAYRKSYCRHTSTDVELAWSLLQMLSQRLPGHPILGIAPEVQKIREIYIHSQLLKAPAPSQIRGELVRLLWSLRRSSEVLEKKIRHLIDPDYRASFGVFNDNQFEQHHWAW